MMYQLKEELSPSGRKVFAKRKDSWGIAYFVKEVSSAGERYKAVRKDWIMANRDSIVNLGVSNNGQIYPIIPKDEKPGNVENSISEKNTERLIYYMLDGMRRLPKTDDSYFSIDYNEAEKICYFNFDYYITNCSESNMNGGSYRVSIGVKNPFNMKRVLDKFDAHLRDISSNNFKKWVMTNFSEDYEFDLRWWLNSSVEHLAIIRERYNKYIEKNNCMSFDDMYKKYKREAVDHLELILIGG